MVTNKPSWKHLLLLACFASSPLATACIEPTVIGGGDDGTGGGGASGGPGSSVGGGQVVSNSLALFWSEMPPFDGSTSVGSTGVGGSSGNDPDTLFVKISSLPVTCDNPWTFGITDDCETGWSLSVNLPVGYQTPGVYQLDDPNLNALISEEQDEGGGACSGGGGWFLQGTFEVVSIDSDGLVVEVTALNQAGIDGTYDVPRCNPLPDDPPQNGLALRYDQFPPIGGDTGSTTAVSSGSGGGPEADTLYVMVANHGITCGNPYGYDEECPVDEWLVSVGLPLAYQTPGVYSLSDPNLFPYTSESGPNGDGSCWGGGGSFFDGTIEVVAIDQATITVKFDGVSDHGAELGVAQVLSRCQ